VCVCVCVYVCVPVCASVRVFYVIHLSFYNVVCLKSETQLSYATFGYKHGVVRTHFCSWGTERNLSALHWQIHRNRCYPSIGL